MSGSPARLALVLALGLGLVLGSGHPAYAEDDEVAAQLFRAGKAAYERRDYRAAARAFEEANRRAPRAAATYGAAIAWEAAGERERAADAYDAALRAKGLEAAESADAESRLAALGASLALVEITEPVGAVASVAHVVRAPIPVRVHLLPGDYAVEVERAGVRASRRVALTAGQSLEIAIELPASAPAIARPSRGTAPSSPKRADDTGSGQRTAGWVTVGAGAVIAGGAAVVGALALDSNASFEDSGNTDADARDRTVALRAGANIAWGAAAVAGVVGVILLLTAPSKPAARAQTSRTVSMTTIRF